MQSFPKHTRHLADKSENVKLEKAMTVGYDPSSDVSVNDFLRNITKQQYDSNTNLNTSEDCISRFFKRWGLPALSRKEGDVFQTGHDNEPLLCSSFVKKINSFRVFGNIKISSLREIGLCCLQTFSAMAVSVDALGVLKETAEVGASIRRLLFVLELKTRCTANTIEKEHSLKEAFGTYVTINLSNENSGKRLRVTTAYESFIKAAQEEVNTPIPWLLKEDIPMETKQLCQQLITKNHRRMKNFPDMNSLLSCYSLAMECNKHPVLISNIFKLKPAPVVAYNKTMGGEDILSRLIRDYAPIADSTTMRLFMECLCFALRNMYAVNQFLNIKKVDDLQSIAQFRKRRDNTTDKGGYQRFLLNLPIPELFFEKDDSDKDTPERGKSKTKRNSTGTIYSSKTVTPHKNLFNEPTNMTPKRIHDSESEFSVAKRFKSDPTAMALEKDRRENCAGVPMFLCSEKEQNNYINNKSKSACSYCHKKTTPSTIIFCLLCHQRFHIQDIHVTPDAMKEYERKLKTNPVQQEPTVSDIFEFKNKHYKNSCWYEAHKTGVMKALSYAHDREENILK
eukprot:Pgem_evm1s11287